MAKQVLHHRKYKEIHGVDDVVLMDKAEHEALHRRLRKEGKCKIPVKELDKISQRASKGHHNRIYYKRHKNELFKYHKNYICDKHPVLTLSILIDKRHCENKVIESYVNDEILYDNKINMIYIVSYFYCQNVP